MDQIKEEEIKKIETLHYGANQIEQRAAEDLYRTGQVSRFVYYAVFDGHGGPYKLYSKFGREHVALYSADNLQIMLERYFSNIDLDNEDIVCKAITQAFMDLDIEMYTKDLPFGTTCTCLLIDYERNKVYQVNLGDSRSILFIGETIISVTKDHDPMDDVEKSRIINAGGKIFLGRVNGDLMVTRAFGDFDLKSTNTEEYDPVNGMISAIPDIKIVPIQKKMLFLLTSDAPFESLDNDKLLTLANECLSKSNDNFMNAAVALAKRIKPVTTDDITIIIGQVN